MDKEVKALFHEHLPEAIIKGQCLAPDISKNCIQNILKQSLPASDAKGLKEGLTWQFLLQLHKVKKCSNRKPKKTFLTRKQRKELDLLKLPVDGWSYTSLEPIRNMWVEYMSKNLDLINRAPTCQDQEWNSFSIIVAKSEMVGAEIKVIRSKVPSLVGMSGIVVLETKMTFQIVTPSSKLKTILKEPSVFQFTLNKLKFTFFGKYLMTRPADRSVKKIKQLMRPDL